MTTSERRDFYPPIEPHATGMLQVSEVHSIYWEVSGNPTAGFGEPLNDTEFQCFLAHRRPPEFARRSIR